MPAGFSPVLFLFDGRPAIGEGNGPRNLRAAIDRLDSYLSRPKYCLPPPDGGARVCRRSQASVSVRLRMEAMLLGPLRLLFLLLMSGVGASTRWILFLHKMSGETFCSMSCVRLGRILSLPCEGISSLEFASMAELLVASLRVLVWRFGSYRFVDEEGGWRAKSEALRSRSVSLAVYILSTSRFASV